VLATRYRFRCRSKLATYRQGRLNQWAHWARAQGPRIFFEGPQLAVVKYIFKSNYLIVDATA